MSRTSDDAPQSPILSASRCPPPPVASEPPLRAIARENEGLVTPDLSPRSARIVTEDLTMESESDPGEKGFVHKSIQ